MLLAGGECNKGAGLAAAMGEGSGNKDRVVFVRCRRAALSLLSKRLRLKRRAARFVGNGWPRGACCRAKSP